MSMVTIALVIVCFIGPSRVNETDLPLWSGPRTRACELTCTVEMDRRGAALKENFAGPRDDFERNVSSSFAGTVVAGQILQHTTRLCVGGRHNHKCIDTGPGIRNHAGLFRFRYFLDNGIPLDAVVLQ